MKKIYLGVVVIMMFILMSCQSKHEPVKGKIIKDFGATYEIENPDFPINPNLKYRVVFDIYNSPQDSSVINPQINTLARFLNMHGLVGVPIENMQIVGVIHGEASEDALDNKAYKKKYGIKNPNADLLDDLAEAGAKIYMCGQSLKSRKMDRDDLAESVQVGLSAMTVIVSLEEQGYHLIRF